MSADHRLLCVKCVTLLYRESQLTDKESNSADLVRTVLESIKLPDLAVSINNERDILMGLKETALYMCAQPVEQMIDKTDLLQRLKLNCHGDEKLYEALEDAIDKEMDPGSTKRTILSMTLFLNDSFRENEIVNMITRASNDLRFNRDKIKDIRQFVQKLHADLEPYQIESNRKDPGIVDSVDLGDDASLSELCEQIQEDDNAATVLKSGWQGLNRMTQGGFRRGETWADTALPHNYKTGFSLTLFKQFAVYNTPVLTDPKKKPLLLRISFEDSLRDNIQFLYQNIWENEHHGQTPDLKKVKPADMAAYVKAKMEATGYHVKMLRVNPSAWTYKNIQSTVLELEANGYEVHCLMLDYLPMVPTTGCEQGPSGHDLRDMVRRMRNFCSAKNILLFTPWQASTDALNKLREGSTDLVKKMKGGGFYAGSKQIFQELDGELYQHIEQQNGRSYLTLQRGKHRKPSIIPETEKYMVLPFPEKGSILDDVGKPEITLKKVGGGPVGSGEEIPFHSFDEGL